MQSTVFGAFPECSPTPNDLCMRVLSDGRWVHACVSFSSCLFLHTTPSAELSARARVCASAAVLSYPTRGGSGHVVRASVCEGVFLPALLHPALKQVERHGKSSPMITSASGTLSCDRAHPLSERRGGGLTGAPTVRPQPPAAPRHCFQPPASTRRPSRPPTVRSQPPAAPFAPASGHPAPAVGPSVRPPSPAACAPVNPPTVGLPRVFDPAAKARRVQLEAPQLPLGPFRGLRYILLRVLVAQRRWGGRLLARSRRPATHRQGGGLTGAASARTHRRRRPCRGRLAAAPVPPRVPRPRTWGGGLNKWVRRRRSRAVRGPKGLPVQGVGLTVQVEGGTPTCPCPS